MSCSSFYNTGTTSGGLFGNSVIGSINNAFGTGSNYGNSNLGNIGIGSTTSNLLCCNCNNSGSIVGGIGSGVGGIGTST